MRKATINGAFRWVTNTGRYSPSYGFRSAKARLTKEVQRRSCAMTVGSGFHTWKTHRDPIGASCEVYGYIFSYSEPLVCVALPNGGFTTLGMSDVEIYDTSDLLPEEIETLNRLPKTVTRIDENGEIMTPEGLPFKSCCDHHK